MYINRGYITKDEYEDFVHYLYNPYAKLGGNGLAERIYKDVSDLPLKRHQYRAEKVSPTSGPIYLTDVSDRCNNET